MSSDARDIATPKTEKTSQPDLSMLGLIPSKPREYPPPPAPFDPVVSSSMAAIRQYCSRTSPKS